MQMQVVETTLAIPADVESPSASIQTVLANVEYSTVCPAFELRGIDVTSPTFECITTREGTASIARRG